MLPEIHLPEVTGDIVATGVSEDDYMATYAADFHEWVEGAVIKLSPVTDEHDEMTSYLRRFMDTYFALHPIGRVKSAPYVMKASDKARRREPDLQIILNTNNGQLTPTAMLGPADICIEVVSEGSEEIDYGTKFVEYQNGGVQEYWLFDLLRREHRFFRLNASQIYTSHPLDADGYYETPLLPSLKVHVPTLWQTPLPDPIATVTTLQAMLGKQDR
ncbi:MAG: Uma2 family endonuclease [Chloroflexi bacterium]|nr:Uma2 family endonuclease [Chloroflexota bacterium]MCC6894558.1 Uma2 family endonuclease [Anaerolineae bacterium]